ncbi:MAG: plastocyanin/azurin family copper-binding protein [Bacteroidota bacterium]
MRLSLLTPAFVALFALVVLGSGCKSDSSNPYGSSPTSPTPATTQSDVVTMSGMAFSPATITVTAGTTVTWKNTDGIAHTSTSDTGVWDTGNMAAGNVTTTTFNTPGTFPYHCIYHASMGMRGTVVVK